MSTENALKLLFRLGKNLKAATGVEPIDKSLDGGFEPGEICELVGQHAVGKTQLLYGLTACYLRNHKGDVAWIDLNGSFIPSRFLSFLRNDERKNIPELLKRILIAHAFKAADLTRLLNKIMDDLPTIKLVLIDNIGSILTQSSYLYKEGDGKEQIQTVVTKMKQCAEEGRTVILTNHLLKIEGNLRPALGFYWRTRHVTQRYLVGKDEISEFFRPAFENFDDNEEENNENFEASGPEISRFSIKSHGIYEFDDLSL